MKAEDIKLGMEVRFLAGSKYETYQVMELPDSDGNLMIALKENNELYSSDYCGAGDLEPIDLEARALAAKKIQNKIDEAADSFEKAFKALIQVREESYQSGLPFHNNDLLSMEHLENVIESHGWSSSSLWC